MLVEEKADEKGANQGSAPSTPPRRPFWPVALLLLVLIVAVLGAAFALDQRFRPRVAIVASPTSVAAGQPTGVPTARGAQATASPVVPTATTMGAPTAVITPTIEPRTETAPTPVGGGARTVAPIATTVSASARPPTTAVATIAAAQGVHATVRPALEQLTPLEREVAEAYVRYWNVRREAYLRMDATLLGQVMADPKLTREREYMAELQANGHGAQINVELNFVVVKATPDEALIDDEYLNRSPLVDLATGKEITLESPTTWKVSSVLKKVDGVWKVVDGVRRD